MKTRVTVLLLSFCLFSAAQVPYKSTSGPVTLWVSDYSNQYGATLIGGSFPLVTGIWITACTTDHTVERLKAVVIYRIAAKGLHPGQVTVDVIDLGPTIKNPEGICASSFLAVPRSAVQSVLMTTAEFSDVAN